MRSEHPARRRLAAALAALLGAAGLAVTATAPSRADVPVVSDFDDIVAFAQTAYSAYQTVSGTPSDLQDAVSQIAARLNSVRLSLVSEIDNTQLVDLSKCMNTTLQTFQNIQTLTPDNLQAFAISASECTYEAQGIIANLTGPSAVDQADAALNTIGPVALLTTAFAHQNSDLLKQKLILGNQQLLTKLAPVCYPSVLSPADVPGVGSGPVTGHLACYNYAVPAPPLVDGRVGYIPARLGVGFDPWEIRGEAGPTDQLIIWGDHGVDWPPDAYVSGGGDYSVAIDQAMAPTSYPIAYAALRQLEDPVAASGSPIAAGVSTRPYSPVEALRVNGDGSVSRNEVRVIDDVLSGWTGLDGQVKSLAEASNADGRLEMFAVDRIGDVFHRWQQSAVDDTSWTPWARMAGQRLTSIAVARDHDGTLQVFGTAPDGTVYTRNQVMGADYAPEIQLPTPVPAVDDWTPWKQIGGQALTQVAAGVDADGQIEVFGLDSAGGVFDSEQTAPDATDPSVPGNWTGWNHLDGTLTSLAVTSDLGGFLNLMGTDPTGTVLHRFQTAENSELWSPWSPVPGATLSHVAAARESFGSGHIDLFGSDASGQILLNTNSGLHGDPWTGWHAVPDTPAVPPGTANPGTQNTTLGASASLTLPASGGTTPYEYSATGLPPGLSLAGNQITGTATTAGTFTAAVTVTDVVGQTGTTTFIWNVEAVTVPSIVGDTRSSASGALSSVGLNLGNERDVVQPACGDGIGVILDQSPAAGAQVALGASVDFDFGVRPTGIHWCQ